jgi:hypothetical protein
VDDTAQESQPFRHISPILPDSLFCGGDVSSEEGFDALGLGKQIRRVTQLRCLDGDRPRKVKYILFAEKV